ncbi:hypothetical protein [Ligilactobacillus hohenheimensis]|uniref:hypothetical protein n=1 Tax=Ligilactobacillus hohenheimensis TaxID=2991832 RepID=UPI0024B9049E|nr:hypothetical protein [Ligilactobacillus hohenheimensis]
MKYTYYAVFHPNAEGQVEVTFPELGIATYGENMTDAQKEAHDALAGYLLVQEDTHSPISEPKKPWGQITASSGDQVIAVTVDTEKER